MHRARLLAAAPDRAPRHRAWLLLAWLAPWLVARAWDGLAQKDAQRRGGALVHLGPVRLVVHLPEGSYSVPWHGVEASREGPVWRVEAAGIVASVVDEHLNGRERRRLQSSTRNRSA